MTSKQPAPLAVSRESPFFGLIQDVYRVFAYPKPKTTGVCENCCMDARIERDFFTPVLRELPLSYVRDWYCAAYDPSGVPKDSWAYLLPRILEILAAGAHVSNVAIEISLNRFKTGNPENWSPAEWRLLDGFRHLYLAHTIEQGDDRLDQVLCMFWLAGWNIADLLGQVASTPDAALARRLWKDWCECRPPGHENIGVSAFWESPGNSTAYEFYTSQGLLDRMEALALADDTDPDLAAKACAVANVIAGSR